MTGLPHLPTKPWLEVGMLALRLQIGRWGRWSNNGTRLKDGASTQKLMFNFYLKIFYLKDNVLFFLEN